MRVEANISVKLINSDKKLINTDGILINTDKLGTKVEVKNLNSFRAVEKAINFEIKRQEEVLESGGKVEQETRGWNDVKEETVSQRSKEEAHDYRYFPEPDLPKMKLHEAFDLAKIKSELPELPEAKRLRYRESFGIKDEDIESYVADQDLAKYSKK